MKRFKFYLTAGAFLLAIGSVFATNISQVESGYYFDAAHPVNQKCVQSIDCEVEESLTPCFVVISPGNIKTLYSKHDFDQCQLLALYRIIVE